MTNEQKKELNRIYRNVFLNSKEGRLVLADILNDVKFFSLADLISDTEIARLNVGRRILGKCGIWEERSFGDILNALGASNPLIELYQIDPQGEDDDN